MISDKGECENCFNHGMHGASGKWQKSVKSMPHSPVYVGFDKHPSQMTQHSFKRVKKELYCHVWFKTKCAETAKHCDVENGQNRWYLHTPVEPYGLGCHYLPKHLWLKSCWYIAVTHLVTSFNGCDVAISIAASHLHDCQKHVDWLSVHKESNIHSTQVIDTCISGCIYQYADEIAVWHLPQPWLKKVHVDDINAPAIPLVDFVATGLLTALANLNLLIVRPFQRAVWSAPLHFLLCFGCS